MVTEKRCIVQFSHPGGEHSPDRGKDYKSWNKGKHKRKFMLAKGDYLANDKIVKDELLLFWGEWEPDSIVFRRLQKITGDYPKYIYSPVLQNTPINKGQNTDPYIFNEEFYYFCCKQTKKNGQITQMAKLATGSIILFGSTINQGKNDSYFALDTVFVVGDYLEYNSSNYREKLKGKVCEYFFDVSLESIYHRFEYSRCYIGANFANKTEGMYSFVPCKKFKNENIGFERVRLTNKDLNFISNDLNTAPKLNKELCNSTNFVEIWNKLRIIIKNQDFCEGVNFSFTKQL